MAPTPRRLGHVNLFVKDMERSMQFYSEVLGLHTNAIRPGFAAFMSADQEQSHEIALMHLGPDAQSLDKNRVGLNHVAWRMDTFEDLKELYRNLKGRGIEPGIGDHGISLGIYFQDPDGNGNEAYFELPREEWPEKKDRDIFAGGFPYSLEDATSGVPAT